MKDTVCEVQGVARMHANLKQANRGHEWSLYYQPKQWISMGKSLKITMHLYDVWFPFHMGPT